MTYRSRTLLMALLMTIGVVAGSTGAAHAVDYPRTSFYACMTHAACDPGGQSRNYTAGKITWYNWAVSVDGTVFADYERAYTLQAVFDAFNGSTKIASEGRTVVQPTDLRDINVDMGGGTAAAKVDRVRITLVTYHDNGGVLYGEQFNFWRP